MTKKQIISEIQALIENGYAETHVGYHADSQFGGGSWDRGCYAQIAKPYGGSYRLYARSYSELLIVVQDALND